MPKRYKFSQLKPSTKRQNDARLYWETCLSKSAWLEPHREIKIILVAAKVANCGYNEKQCGVIVQKVILSTQDKHHYNSG